MVGAPHLVDAAVRESIAVSLLLFSGEGHMSAPVQHKRGMRVVKTRKTKGKAQHSWRVSRSNNQSVIVTADGLNVVDGELVFTTSGLPVRIIAADTYTDVELVESAVD
jgi:hypothetical protein